MKIAILTTVLNRLDITGSVLSHYTRMKEHTEHPVTLHAVCSRESDAVACRRRGWNVHYFPNSPLNEKHNFGAQALEDWDVDAVCVVNSDDLFSDRYLDVASSALNDGEDMVRFLSYVFVDTVEGRAAYVPKALPASGIFMSRDLMEALDWLPWQGDPINRFLDTRLGENLEEVGAQGVALSPAPDHRTQLCSLKSEYNMWSYEEHIEQCESPTSDVDAREYMEMHFPRPLQKIEIPNYAQL